MTTITLTPAQINVVLTSLNGTLEAIFQAVRTLDSSAEDTFVTYDGMMDEYEQMAAVKALIQAQIAQPDSKPATEALCKLGVAHGREAIVEVLAQFGVKNMTEMHPSNFEKVPEACAKYAPH